MNNWLDKISENSVLITIVKTKGSTPCRIGDKIIFKDEKIIFGSIGGGSLEYKSCQYAQNIINSNDKIIDFMDFKLGDKSDQCFGGVVKIMFEKIKDTIWFKKLKTLQEKSNDFVIITTIKNNNQIFEKFVYHENKLEPNLEKFLNENLVLQTISNIKKLLKSKQKISIQDIKVNSDFFKFCFEFFEKPQPVVIFGAGHIAKALVLILKKLSINVFLVDDRKDKIFAFDKQNINLLNENFILAIDEIPNNSYCLVMTYSHEKDFAICEKLLLKDNFSYLGLIGSKTKGNRFRSYLRDQGFSKNVISKLQCPIGKKRKFMQSPMAIAVSIADKLIDYLEVKNQEISL